MHYIRSASSGMPLGGIGRESYRRAIVGVGADVYRPLQKAKVTPAIVGGHCGLLGRRIGDSTVEEAAKQGAKHQGAEL